MAGTDKVKSPFTRVQRNQLLAWSKFAKEEDILNGFQRKVLYEGGHYNYVFVSRLNLVTETLKALREHLDEEADDLAYEIMVTGYVCFLNAHAEKGNAEAKYLLADGYYWGKYGLEMDDAEALRLMQESAKQDYQDALVMVGLWYAQGLIVDEDPKAAFNFYSRAHELGSKDGTFRLATAYQRGTGVEEDAIHAFLLMKEAAEAGNTPAMNYLGEYFSFATGTEEDMDKAIFWWEKAAEEEHKRALFWLGFTYSTGDGVEQDLDRAANYFERSHEAGNVQATYELGLAYYLGAGREENDERAVELFKEAYDGGDIDATYRLAFCLHAGIGVSADHERAVELFKECCDEHPQAHFHLGEAARAGLGRPKNLETAFDHYLKAAEDGVDIAKAAIGRAFFLGEGVAESDADAVKWFSLVADDEDLAKYYLGQCYYDGVGVPEDEALGVNLLRQAAEGGMEEAKDLLFKLGHELEETALNSEENLGNVVSVYQDRESRAASIYNRFMDEERSGSAKDSATVIALQTNMESRIEEMMKDR